MTRDASDIPDETQESPQDPPASRKQSLLFLAKFLIFVSIFLIGYRYAINTAPNIRYLYAIASQTSFALNILGHESRLEPHRSQYPAEQLRGDLKEWRVVKKGPLPPVNGDGPPLTAWEFWLHSAHQEIRRGPGLLDHGPTIRFTARQGLTSQRIEASQKLAKIDRTDASVSEVLDLQGKINSLDEKIAALATAENAAQKLNDRKFDFRIVPDCGAIPSLSIYLAAVLAFPVAWRKRFIGAVAGFVTLYAINIARLVMLGFVGAYDPTPNHERFTFIHEYVWQSIFLLFVVCVWLAWIELVVKPKQVDAP